MDINSLIEKVKEYNSKSDVNLIKKAYELSEKLHKGQKRKSGEPYIIHPLNVAYILAELKLDDKSICAGLLHDVLEDTSIDYNKLKEEFGKEIADLVDGVTKVNILKTKGKRDYHAETESIKKMLLACTRDIRVLIIKLADKLHNMRTLEYIEDKTRKDEIAKEVLDLYAPLAYRLGLFNLKSELEDLAFKQLYNQLYEDFKKKIIKNKQQREEDVSKLKRELGDLFKKNKIKVLEISGRSKSFYSIYNKMIKKNKSFEEIYDLIGLRIITKTKNDCYEVLSLLHNHWKNNHERFKDYITNPKENLYQSLHTVVDADGLRVEVQIRTKDMDDVAEGGIAAHFKYKDLGLTGSFDRRINWIKQILDWKESKSGHDTVNVDVFGDKIYVFTPKGDVVELPVGSTPVDFAYSVHSDLGDKCDGARVNGKFVSLRQILNNGDVVEIIKSKNRLIPSRDWMKFVKSPKAKLKIRSAIKLLQKIPVGSRKDVIDDENRGSLIETGLKNPVVNIAKCCKSLPGDKLIGIVSMSNRVMVHKNDCTRIREKIGSKSRIKVNWKDDIKTNIVLKVRAYDRIGLFADILHNLSNSGNKIISAKAHTHGKDETICEFTLYFDKLNELTEIIKKINKISGVKEINLGI